MIRRRAYWTASAITTARTTAAKPSSCARCNKTCDRKATPPAALSSAIEWTDVRKSLLADHLANPNGLDERHHRLLHQLAAQYAAAVKAGLPFE